MNVAIILAGGSGQRFGSKLPKQYILIKDKPILYYTLSTFNSCKYIDDIIIVSNVQYLEKTKSIVNEYNINKVKNIISGGDNRQDSVYCALKYLKNNKYKNDDIIVIHDSVRPMIDKKTIENCINKAITYGASTAAIKTKDTIVIKKQDKIDKNLDRNLLCNIQTPQCFKLDVIYKAHTFPKKIDNATDDTVLVRNMGKDVHLVESNNDNIKITTPIDMYIFEKYLDNQNI